jgi:hypothetical protein
MTRSLVSGAIGTLVSTPLSTRETVLCDTSAAAAMSRMVATLRRGPGGSALSVRPAAGGSSSAGVARSMGNGRRRRDSDMRRTLLRYAVIRLHACACRQLIKLGAVLRRRARGSTGDRDGYADPASQPRSGRPGRRC